MKTTIFALALMFSFSAFAAHHGKILTNGEGMTLYTFDRDSGGIPSCYGGCAKKWPPYLAKPGVDVKEGWSLVSRKDGSKQWAYQGQPLYTWREDKKPGDISGNGVNGIWHIAEKAVEPVGRGY